MRKSGWAAAAALGSLVLLLAACGGTSSPTAATGSGSSTVQAGSGSSGPAAPASSVSAASTASSKGGGTTPTARATPHHSVGPQPSSGDQSIPAAGTTVMIVQHSAVGFVLAVAGGQVVYTYAKDKKGGTPTCTGACAATWLPVTGTPQASPADTFPGQFAVVKNASGVGQITYNGYPLYTLKGAKPYAVTGNNMGGVWHVVPLSASDIKA